jgi:hypothetical protein
MLDKSSSVMKLIDSRSFIETIEKSVRDRKLDYMDAVVEFCTKNGIEIETAALIIRANSGIKAKIQDEAEALNYMPKTAKLPI